MKKILFALIVLIPYLLPGALLAETAVDAMKKSQAAFYYPAKDFKARVMMKLTARNGQERIREMAMLRKNYGQPGGDQKYFIYFFQPSDVRDTALMVYKYPAKDDDRWLFVPAINMVKRIAAQDKASSFVGSDFTYEDVSGRDIEDDTHEFVKIEETAALPCAQKKCMKVRSTPRKEDVDYSYKLSWIDAGNYLPLKEEYYDKKGDLYRVFTADEIKDVNGIPTIVRRSMKNLQSGHSTEVAFTRVDYNIGLEDSLFTERFLRQPPRKRLE